MKRVIDGQTYNTDTSARVARFEYEDTQGYDTTATLYQTRGGAFFLVHEWEVDERVKVHFETMTRDEVLRMVEKTDNLEIIDAAILDEPPEAQVSEEPAATLYVRVPASLKKRVDQEAQDASISGNAWVMKCVERCMKLNSIWGHKNLALAWEIATTFRAHSDGTWPREKMLEAFTEIADYLDAAIEEMVGEADSGDVHSAFGLEWQEIQDKYKPFQD